MRVRSCNVSFSGFLSSISFVQSPTRVVTDHVFKALESEARGDVVPAVVESVDTVVLYDPVLHWQRIQTCRCTHTTFSHSTKLLCSPEHKKVNNCGHTRWKCQNSAQMRSFNHVSPMQSCLVLNSWNCMHQYLQFCCIVVYKRSKSFQKNLNQAGQAGGSHDHFSLPTVYSRPKTSHSSSSV